MIKVIRKYNKLWLICAFASYISLGHGQENVKVLTKTIDKSFPYQNQRIEIIGEKAMVNITGWTKKLVVVQLKLIAKHNSREVIDREIDYCRYILKDEHDVIELKNFFVLPKNTDGVQADLRAEYEVFLPIGVEAKITNNYGNTVIKKVSGSLTMDAAYGDLYLNDLLSDIDITAKYGDIVMRNCSGNVNCTAKYAKIEMHKHRGVFVANLSYADVILGILNDVSNINITAKRSDIQIETGSLTEFGFDFVNQYGDITVPNKLRDKLIIDDSRQTFQTNGEKEIQISNSFGEIKILNIVYE